MVSTRETDPAHFREVPISQLERAYLKTEGELDDAHELIIKMSDLLLKIAKAECDARMSGRDGAGWGFSIASGEQDGIDGFGQTELDAAIAFLRSKYD